MSQKHQAEQTAKQDETRDESGRFVFGNPGGPGNPYARRVGELRRAMLLAVSVEDIAAILKAMIEKAKEGNVQAAKLVLSYALGKPEKVQDPDREDAHEWEVQKETAQMYEEMGQVMKAPPASITLGATRVLRPLFGSIIKEQMVDMFLHPGKHFPHLNEEEGGEEAEEGSERSPNGESEGSGARSAQPTDTVRGLEPTPNGNSVGEAELRELLEWLQERGVHGVAGRR